ncbi:AfsR/SARP family transcriptional regulator [Lentzea nigeriaca]|uniref:AfsR/SARP family transcriptional regulator n=1 Tax=Lentzea nigeriaca TaxID=1128665 RepID=UPI00195EA587|nr:BTAD domain-containing putative transcriptional regulator [Lentzea nigeriaca]MBM7856301.1 DNA-binding SARP family transcriptional activator/tetratricopeptide (TPR) repeat protein [Lentzea nigeriaca]
MEADFRVLGPLSVLAGGNTVEFGRRRERCLLGVLLIQPGQAVPVERLLDLLWDGEPPATGRAGLHTHVARLRGDLRRAGVGLDVVRLCNSPNGYLAEMDPALVDSHRFRELTARARRSADLAGAAVLLRQALALWRGSVLAGDAPDRLRDRVGSDLVELRLSATELLVDAELALGRHRELIGELTALTAEHPHHERFVGQLMLAVYRSGRQTEALEIYERFRVRLADALGVDPGPELSRLHLGVLRHDQDVVGLPQPAVATTAATTGRPALLPADVGDFIGREQQLAEVAAALTGGGRAVRMAVITGQGGIGKTTLAVRVGHDLRERFPDGQLYANLRGTQATLTSPAEVLARFLRRLGVEGTAVPDSLDERVDLYRSLLDERHVLVLLDDARDAAQVRPLLPGSARCAALVTSRQRLSEVDGAVVVPLTGFSPVEATRLLRGLCGADRVDAQPEDTAAIVRLCGHLPLAIRIAGVRLAARPHWPLAMLAARLSDARRRLDELATGDLAVAASFAISYRLLDEDARRALRLLALLETDDFAAWTAAALMDVGVRHAEDLVEALVDAHLVEPAGVDPAGRLRYRLHDLVRLFARVRAEDEDSVADRHVALSRALGAWLDLTEQAAATLSYRLLVPIRGTASRHRLSDVDPAELPGEAFGWLSAEHGALRAAIRQACALGLDEVAWELTAAVRDLFEQRDHIVDLTETHTLALAACEKAGNRRGEAVMLYGRACLASHSPELGLGDALDLIEGARLRFQELGEVHGEVDSLVLAGAIHRMHGDHIRSGEVLTRAARRARAAGNETAEAAAWRSLGVLHWERRHLSDARRCFTYALALARRASLPDVEAFALRGLGVLHRERGEWERAMDFFCRALECLEQLGGQRGIADALLDLGQLYTACRDPRARAMLERAAELHGQAGNVHGSAVALRALGELSQTEGDLAAAVEHLVRSLSLWRELRQPYGTALALRALGAAHRTAGDLDGARDRWREAVVVFTAIGCGPEAADVSRDLEALQALDADQRNARHSLEHS